MGAFDQITQMAEEYRSKIKAEGRSLLMSHFAELFAAKPDLVSVRWQQYTPYFNDGDPCEFRVHDFGYRFTGTADDAGDYEDGYLSSWSIHPEELKAELEAFAKIPVDVMETVFGDHMEITATRDGFEVEEHEHD